MIIICLRWNGTKKYAASDSLWNCAEVKNDKKWHSNVPIPDHARFYQGPTLGHSRDKILPARLGESAADGQPQPLHKRNVGGTACRRLTGAKQPRKNNFTWAATCRSTSVAPCAWSAQVVSFAEPISLRLFHISWAADEHAPLVRRSRRGANECPLCSGPADPRSAYKSRLFPRH